MLDQLEAMKVVTLVIARETRPQILEVEAQVRNLASTVDRFYELLGPRNWIFHDDLQIPLVEQLVALEADDAERSLIESYKDINVLGMSVRRLGRFPELAVRMPLLERAQSDFASGRYYSTVNLLLSVMDGFVNDLEPGERKGLHAKEASELGAWDSVVGHHLGLTHAHETFKKSFRKVVTDEVTELYRNGIVHGMVVNYDNDVVATKAWNRLFAVADWATSRQKQAQPVTAKKSMRETLEDLARMREARESLDRWEPSIIQADAPDFELDNVVSAARQYLDAWKGRNYGHMASFLSPLVSAETVAGTAGDVRREMAGHALADYEFQRVDNPAAAVANVDLRVLIGGEWAQARMRWVRCDDRGVGVSPIEAGTWKLMTWTSSGMVNERTKPAAPFSRV